MTYIALRPGYKISNVSHNGYTILNSKILIIAGFLTLQIDTTLRVRLSQDGGTKLSGARVTRLQAKRAKRNSELYFHPI